MSVLALALKRLSLSHWDTPTHVPVGQRQSDDNARTLGIIGTAGTSGAVGTNETIGPNGTDSSTVAMSRFDREEQARSYEYEERAAICEFDGGLPQENAEQLAALHAMPLPLGVTEEQRGILIDVSGRFLDRQGRGALKR
jgi:hypothetical protein